MKMQEIENRIANLKKRMNGCEPFFLMTLRRGVIVEQDKLIKMQKEIIERGNMNE